MWFTTYVEVGFHILYRNNNETDYSFSGGGTNIGSIETEFEDYIFFGSGGGWYRTYLINGESLTITGITDSGEPYRCVGFSEFNTTPGTPTESGYSTTIVANKDGAYSVYFDKLAEETEYFYDLGKGHENLAAQVVSYMKNNPSSPRRTTTVNDAELMPDGKTIKIKSTDASVHRMVLDDLYNITMLVLEEGAIDNNKQFFNAGRKTVSGYGSYENYGSDIRAAGVDSSSFSGKTFYALWFEPVSEVDLQIKAPICGTKITADKYVIDDDPGQGGLIPIDDPSFIYNQYSQKPRPIITITSKNATVIDSYGRGEDAGKYSFWVKDNYDIIHGMLQADILHDTTVKGGEKYKALFGLRSLFGYYFPDTIRVTVNKEVLGPDAVTKSRFFEDRYLQMRLLGMADVEAEHDWGAWTVTRKPTTKREGEETRTCKHCDAKETRPIPKKGTSPKTADESYPVLWITVMLMALAMLTCTMTVRIRQRRRRSE